MAESISSAPPSLSNPDVFADLFPATHEAQQAAFVALIEAGEASTPAARAMVLSQSVLASAYGSTSAATAKRGRSKEDQADDAMAKQQREVSEAFDKMERKRLRDEAMKRVKATYETWDNPPPSLTPGERRYPIPADKALAEVKRAVNIWLHNGEAREERAERVGALLHELDEWLRSESAADGFDTAPNESMAAGTPISSTGAAEALEEASAAEVMALLSAQEESKAQLAKQISSLQQGANKAANAAAKAKSLAAAAQAEVDELRKPADEAAEAVSAARPHCCHRCHRAPPPRPTGAALALALAAHACVRAVALV
jgi:hypothetical protein